jgi:hypothetical protein
MIVSASKENLAYYSTIIFILRELCSMLTNKNIRREPYYKIRDALAKREREEMHWSRKKQIPHCMQHKDLNSVELSEIMI